MTNTAAAFKPGQAVTVRHISGYDLPATVVSVRPSVPAAGGFAYLVNVEGVGAYNTTHNLVTAR